MRTKEQIENLRKVLRMQVGPIANFFSDEEINKFADRLQDHINLMEKSSSHLWSIFSKIKGESNFAEEPTTFYGSFNALAEKCKRLLEKYPKLEAMKVKSEDSDEYIFDRSKENAAQETTLSC